MNKEAGMEISIRSVLLLISLILAVFSARASSFIFAIFLIVSGIVMVFEMFVDPLGILISRFLRKKKDDDAPEASDVVDIGRMSERLKEKEAASKKLKVVFKK